MGDRVAVKDLPPGKKALFYVLAALTVMMGVTWLQDPEALRQPGELAWVAFFVGLPAWGAWVLYGQAEKLGADRGREEASAEAAVAVHRVVEEPLVVQVPAGRVEPAAPRPRVRPRPSPPRAGEKAPRVTVDLSRPENLPDGCVNCGNWVTCYPTRKDVNANWDYWCEEYQRSDEFTKVKKGPGVDLGLNGGRGKGR